MDRFDEPDTELRPRAVARVNPGGQPVSEFGVIQMYTMEQRTGHKTAVPIQAFLCKHCSDVFGSEHGLKIHIGRAHGDVPRTHE